MSEHFEFYELDPPKEGDQPQLPPMFSSQEVLNGQSVFNKAVTAANSGDVGTVFYSCDEGILNVAITLNPEVIKSKAIQVHYLSSFSCRLDYICLCTYCTLGVGWRWLVVRNGSA